MSIQTLYRVQCQPCERYLASEETEVVATSVSPDSPLFIDFSSAYDEAVRRGWSAWPLLCPDCAADLAKRVRDGEQVRGDDTVPEDRGAVPEPGQGAERAGSGG